jgi:hypothetical protein
MNGRSGQQRSISHRPSNLAVENLKLVPQTRSSSPSRPSHDDSEQLGRLEFDECDK